jgi:tRNA-binding protein
MKISYDDIERAFLFVSSEPMFTNQALLSRTTGKIFYISDVGDSDDLPDDIEDADDVIEIPHQNELDLGNRLVDQFVSEHLPEEADTVSDFFERRGAYSRYKDLLARKGLLEKWYDFEGSQRKEALRNWCAENKVELAVRKGPAQGPRKRGGAPLSPANRGPAPVKPMISIEDLQKVDIRVGTIRLVDNVTGSKKLVRLTVDFGDHIRTILAGMKHERNDPAGIAGRQALFVVNLKPRKMAGIMSDGMLFDIGYEDGITPVLAVPETPVPDGSRAG